MRIKERLPRTIAAFLALVVGCSTPPNEPDAPGPTVDLAVTVDLAGFPSVDVIAVEVDAPDIASTLNFNIPVSNGTASGTIAVPAGSNRTITATALDAAGIATHRGSTTITIRESNNPVLTLTILPLMGDQAIQVVFGSVFVAISPTSDTLLTGETLKLSAIVVDGNDDTLSVSVSWASLNPTRATVDTAGIVNAHSAGDVQIVATYGGSAAATDLHVQHSRYSLRFNGSQIVTVPDDPALNPPNEMTLEFWVKFDSLAAGQWGVLKDDGSVRHFALGLNGTTSPGPARKIRAHIRAGGPGGYYTVDGATTIPWDTWTHVAQTYDGTRLRLFINGHQDGEATVGLPLVSEPVALTFGDNAEGFPLSGSIDDVRLWAVASVVSPKSVSLCSPSSGSHGPRRSRRTAWGVRCGHRCSR